jgi:hypothetical protein
MQLVCPSLPRLPPLPLPFVPKGPSNSPVDHILLLIHCTVQPFEAHDALAFIFQKLFKRTCPHHISSPFETIKHEFHFPDPLPTLFTDIHPHVLTYLRPVDDPIGRT